MKIIAVASQGGHWVQLQRLEPALYGINENVTLKYVTTKPIMINSSRGELIKSDVVTDCNLREFFLILKCLIQCIKIVTNFKPSVIISTGAAPGLLMIIIGKMFFIKTIWIDSIANTKELSLSGRIAKHICSHTFTQWPELVTKNVKFIGNIL